MTLLLALFVMISNLNAVSYSCPVADKEFVQQLVDKNTDTFYFLGSWDNSQERGIIESTLKNFPKEGLAPKKDPDNKAVCMYTMPSEGSFFVFNCPQLNAGDIQGIYNNQEAGLSFDENSRQNLNTYFDELAEYKAKIASVQFVKNSSNSQNACVYSMTSTPTRNGSLELNVNVILSPKL